MAAPWRQKMEWISFKDKKPGGEICVVLDIDHEIGIGVYIEGRWWVENIDNEGIIYWLPIPKFPKKSAA